MRCLNTVNGEGFKQLYQALIDSGYKYGLAKLSKPSVEVLFPDCTNMSRNLKEVKLIEISTDYWRNSYTNENFLTINIHYTKSDNPVTYMLKTLYFSGTKSGENTIRIIKSVLRSYGLDQDGKHVIYLTDNASNFISGLKDEDVMMEFAQENQPDSNDEEEDDEVDRYVKSKLIINHEESVLNWWKK
ncbi:unnamed protein product [Rotaria sp. Silwood1]|nr:unnamed protein product [Rotaria sp. Silwood1]CAF3849372.1 unnamed protein product [Rotaria sp. Silwood1]CAF4574402.1 unnamed protein product [Rotaria sp. Silwood1]